MQGRVVQRTEEVDNAETAAAVAIEDREEAARKLATAQAKLEDAKGKQQHSLQVTASPSALPEVRSSVHTPIWSCRYASGLAVDLSCLVYLLNCT